MGNSIVDLGAAAADYVSEAAEYVGGAFSNAYEYMTESPKASASETYIERKSRKGQQLYSGRDPQKPFFDFAQGGIVGQLGELGTMSAEMSDELSMLVNGTPAGGGGFSDLAFPTEGNPGTAAKAYGTIDNLQQGPIGVGQPVMSPTGIGPVINNSDEFISYHKLPNGTGFEYDRRTRVALPPGAMGVSYDEYINLPKQEKQSLLSASGGGLFGDNMSGLEAYTGGSSTFDESAPYDPGQLGINPPGSSPPGFYDNDPLQKSISDGNSPYKFEPTPYSNNPYPDLFSNQRPQPLSYGIGSTTYGFDDGGAVEGIMSVDLSKGADTMRPTPPSGLESFDIYTDLAPEQFKRRPMAKQNFDKKRGFQFGQMVELRDDAVGGKLLKQAGIMTPVDQVKQTVDPKVMDQMSRILGREVA